MSNRGGKPPAEYKFKKGISGNPKGRPRGSGKAKQPTTVFDVIAKPIAVRVGETTTLMSVKDAMAMAAWQQATITGNKRARAEVLDMLIEWDRARRASQRSQCLPGYQVEHPDPDNAHEAMVVLGIAAYAGEAAKDLGPENGPGQRLLLEPWAVELALRRRSLVNLSSVDRVHIQRWTHGSINWPPRFRDGQ